MNPMPLHYRHMISATRSTHDLRHEIDIRSTLQDRYTISALRSTHDFHQADQMQMLTHHTILTNPKCKVTLDVK